MAGTDQDDLSAQRAFWNRYNQTREHTRTRISNDQERVVLSWLEALDQRHLQMIDVGCGAGWLCEKLLPYGAVIGTDLSDEALRRTAARVPAVTFIAGNFLDLDFGKEHFDVVVTLETLAHIEDQEAFIAKAAMLLKPGGYLMLATQNRSALEKNDVPPPSPGQLRHWVDRDELRALLEPAFDVKELFSITPKFNRGALKLINADKVRQGFHAVGLDAVIAAADRIQEKAWMGWTLMALARKR